MIDPLLPKDKRPFTLQQAFNEFLDPERVGIIDLRRTTPAMPLEIISTGKCIYGRN